MSEALRSLLQAEAETARPPVLFGPALRTRVRRRRWVPLTAAAAAIASIIVATYLVVPGLGRDAALPASNRYPSWPTRGDLAGSEPLRSLALRTWDAAPLRSDELPHRAVQVLYAGSSLAGPVVVLSGVDHRGVRRWAVLNADATSRTAYRRLHLLLDQPAPDPSSTRALSYAAPRNTPTPTHDQLVVIVAPPGSTRLSWHGLSRGGLLHGRDGAVAEVVRDEQSLDIAVGWRDDAGGHRARAAHPGLLGGIAYQPDTPVRTDASCNTDGDCSVSAGGAVVTGTRPQGREDLRQGGLVTPADWDEFEAEALQAQISSQPPGDGSVTGTQSWSGLLPDGTGGYLMSRSVGGGPRLLALYADHPSADGGRIVAVLSTADPVPVISAVVPGERHPWLMAPAVTGWGLQVREGSGAWVDANRGTAPLSTELLYASLTGRGTVMVRYIRPDGTVETARRPDSG
ncbi:MAG: hypothetical protein LC789_08195 [Actinobacteria bacterium]|nr:hypothetical protein [Actinomycetota bacterium]MCA1720080.1 hypothetical protein [Actinomycetota bacterium]